MTKSYELAITGIKSRGIYFGHHDPAILLFCPMEAEEPSSASSKLRKCNVISLNGGQGIQLQQGKSGLNTDECFVLGDELKSNSAESPKMETTVHYYCRQEAKCTNTQNYDAHRNEKMLRMGRNAVKPHGLLHNWLKAIDMEYFDVSNY